MKKRTVDPAATRRVARMRLLTLHQVIEITNVCRTQIYDLMERGRFPRSIEVGVRSVRWIESEVLEFIAGCPRTRPRRPPQAAESSGVRPARTMSTICCGHSAVRGGVVFGIANASHPDH